MNNFAYCLSFTLDHEGGTNYLVNDRGGLTKYGISQRQYPDLDIANITGDQAYEIYWRDYWNAAGCEKLPWPLDFTVFDTAVNCGVHSAVVWVQKSVNRPFSTPVKVDGVMGMETRYAIVTYDPFNTAARVAGHRLRRYTKIIGRDPTQRQFVIGWMSRVSDLLLLF